MAIVIDEDSKNDVVTVRDDGVLEARLGGDGPTWLAISPMAIDAIRSHASQEHCVIYVGPRQVVIRVSTERMMACWHEGRRRWIQAIGKS